MYNISVYQVPEGYKLSEYAIILCRDIQEGRNVEDAKDKLFRMTYPIMIQELRKYRNMAPMEETITDLSLAFMKTINNFKPDKEGASFINYYKRTLKTEIIYNYYGKYRVTEETRNLKRAFEGTMGSLDDVVFDKHDVETGSWYDMVEDIGINVENDILEKDYKNTIHKMIDKVFDRDHKGRHSHKPKAIFTDYIDAVLDDKGLKGIELADKYSVGKTAISNCIKKYEPRFKEEFKKHI